MESDNDTLTNRYNVKLTVKTFYPHKFKLQYISLITVVLDKTGIIELGLILGCLYLIAVTCVIGAVISGGNVFNDFWFDVSILLVFIFSTCVVNFSPTMALPFFGYHIFLKT